MIGRFIVFEGPHGSGKTTQAKLLKSYYDSRDIQSIYTKEPYLEELKPLIEKYSSKDDNVSAHMLLYLHAADRFAHVKFIKEKLKEGYNVISDRYVISSYVYQEIQELPLEFIEQVNSFYVEPDITFILDVPLEERKRRLKENNRIRNTIFFKGDYLKAEENLYQKIYRRYKNKWKKIFLINGCIDKDKIFEEHIISLLDII